MGDMQGEAIAAPGRAAPGAGRGAIAALRSRTGLSVALLLVLAAFWLLGAARGASLADLLSLTVWGVMLGGIIALGAIGLTLVYGVLKFPNFAHGELVTVGAYAAFTFMGFLPQGAALRPFSFGPELIVALLLAVPVVSLVALGLIGLNVYTAARYADVKPLVVRIDEVGRAEAVAYDASRYQPQPPELRYFLTQFVVKHFGRIRATVQREYPDSLLFLEPGLADATIAQNDQSRSIETFVTNPSADEIEIVVQNVSLSELTTTPFKAAVALYPLCLYGGLRQLNAPP